MYFEQFADPAKGCLSYFVGCPSEGIAVVVDPFLPARRYARVAEEHAMRIAMVVDTHLHADHRSTGRELARSAGAEYLMHASAGVEGRVGALNDRDVLKAGKVAVRVLHTPGHTRESVSLLVSDLKRSDEPWFALTGDTLFVGDVGRPDAHVHPRAAAAEELHASLARLVRELGDGVEVFPAHYAGSACGRYLSPKPSSTMGFERRHNIGLQQATLQAFVEYASQDLQPIPDAEENLRANRGLFEEPPR